MTEWFDIKKILPDEKEPYLHAVDMLPGDLISRLQEAGFKVFHLDGSKIHNEKEFFDEAARVFGFPAYFGRNWAAWNDCLGDFSCMIPHKTAIVWSNTDQTRTSDAKTYSLVVEDLEGEALCLALGSHIHPGEKKQLEVFLTK
jgi:RNAse (barnase) inhibitor barstar